MKQCAIERERIDNGEWTFDTPGIYEAVRGRYLFMGQEVLEPVLVLGVR